MDIKEFISKSKETPVTKKQVEELQKKLEAEKGNDLYPTNEFLNRTYSI
jgi:hypothetical protein